MPDFPPAADLDRFRWLTRSAVVAEREAALLLRLGPLPGLLLEIGAGEGANLFHLRARGQGALAVALDRAEPKLQVARALGPGVSAVVGDALHLPFRSGSFPSVLLRDVLHHVSDRGQALAEAARVVQPGGRLAVLEGNGETVLARLFAALVAHERGLAASRLERLVAEFVALPGVELERAEKVEPMPLFRLLFHYRYGLPGLAAWPSAGRFAGWLERLGGRAGGQGSYLLLLARAGPASSRGTASTARSRHSARGAS